MNPNLKLALRILFALYYGPRYLVKVGEADFGNFLVILLIQAKANASNNFMTYPTRLPRGSVRKILDFLHIFPILSEHQRAILAEFKDISDDSDVEEFLCRNFGSDYQKIIDKYESMFKWMLPQLLKLGLKISPRYQGRYACSCAKWVLVKMIFCITSDISPNVTQVMAEKTLSPQSQRIAFCVSILQELGTNHFLQLYLQTINQFERTGDSNCFTFAEQEYDKMVISNYQDYQAWVELHAKYQQEFGFSFQLHPTKWTNSLIGWLMNGFDNYDSLCQFIVEVNAN
jgi:hypothetical protein